MAVATERSSLGAVSTVNAVPGARSRFCEVFPDDADGGTEPGNASRGVPFSKVVHCVLFSPLTDLARRFQKIEVSSGRAGKPGAGMQRRPNLPAGKFGWHRDRLTGRSSFGSIARLSSRRNESLPRSTSSVAPRAGLLVTCVVAIAAIVLSPGRARATTYDDIEDGDSSFFSPEIIDSPAEVPFFLSFHVLYHRTYRDSSPPFEELAAVNTKEWSAYFHGKVAEPNLAFLLYKMKLGELDKLIWAMEGKSQSLSKGSAALKAELDAVGDKGQVVKSLYYLGFAKRCEPIASRRLTNDAWDTQKFAAARERDAQTAATLLTGSEALLASTQDKFLQDRYRYQRIRLMFYTGRYAQAEQYYTANITAFTIESSVKYRFMGAAAGSYYHDKQFGRANYLYSLIFDHFAPLRRSVYLSFHPVEEVDWQQCLSLAKNEREKTVIWQMLGIRFNGLAAIEKIYAMAPTSNLLPLLLVQREGHRQGARALPGGRAQVAQG